MAPHNSTIYTYQAALWKGLSVKIHFLNWGPYTSTVNTIIFYKIHFQLSWTDFYNSKPFHVHLIFVYSELYLGLNLLANTYVNIQ